MHRVLRLKSRYNHLYLVRLSREPVLLVSFLAFILADRYFDYRNVEFPGFFQWSMYSTPMKSQDTFYIREMMINDQEVFNRSTFLTHQQAMMFTYTIESFDKYQLTGLQESAFSKWPTHSAVEKEALHAYPEWLRRYTEKVTGLKIRTLRVQETQVFYLPSGRVQGRVVRTLFSIEDSSSATR